MGLAARPGRGVPAVHHDHETPADRRIPGWRTGPEPVGSAVSAVHVSAARGAPRSGSCAGSLKDCNIAAAAHGFRSTFRDWAAEETDHPREVIEAALAHVVGNKVEAAYVRPDLFERRRRLMDDGKPTSRRAPEGAGAHRADRTRRQPAGAWVSSTSHVTTAPGRPRAVGVRSSSTVIATLSTATASSSPRRPSSPCSRRARLRGWLARTVVPSAPGAGWTAPAPNAGSAGGADAAPGRTWNCGPASIPWP